MTDPAASKPIRILLVDDHMIFRKLLLKALSKSHDVEVVGEAANGLEAMERAATLLPDIILMDIHMPKMDGIEATRTIRQRQPQTCIIGLSADDSERRAEMYAAGAFTVLAKEHVVDELYPALRRGMAEKTGGKIEVAVSGREASPC